MSLNQNLKDLYRDNLQIIETISEELKDDFDGPLLMNSWDEEFESAKFKILFIGQEHTNTYWFANDAIEAPLKWYEKFELGKNYNSPFWRAVKQINKTLNRNKSHKRNFLWTNVSKYSTSEGKSIGYEIHSHLVKDLGFNLLANEIKIIKPDAIIFLSGSKYDNWIKIQFPYDLNFDTPLQSNIPSEELSLITCKDEVPIIPKYTYRTHHPMTLLFNKWHYLNIISLHIMGFNFEDILEKFNRGLSHLVGVRVKKIETNFGSKESTFTLQVPTWKNFSIGFQFEDDGFTSLFYGVFKNDIGLENKCVITQLNSLQDNNNNTLSLLWPYWDWFEARDWNKKTFEEILNGSFFIKIQKAIDAILEKTKGWDL